MGTTLPVAIVNLVGFYAIAIPISYYLAFERGIGLPGIWWGLCVGLAVVSVALLIWIQLRGPKTHRGPISVEE